MVKTREGLVIPVPKGWFGSNETGSTGGYWNLYDHDPVKSVKNGIGITIRTADQGVKQVGNVPMCPRSIEETRIDYCGFVTFAQHRWRHIIGETDVPFTEYVTISGRFFYRLIGFYPHNDTAARIQVQSILLRARILEPSA